MPLTDGDVLMLCSDGLTCAVDDETITQILRDHPNPTQAAQACVECAIARGSLDNVTVLVITVDGTPEQILTAWPEESEETLMF